MALDVVVTNYRTPDMLREFIASYEEHKFKGCTLTIVDVDPMAMTSYGDYMQFNSRENCGYGEAYRHLEPQPGPVTPSFWLMLTPSLPPA